MLYLIASGKAGFERSAEFASNSYGIYPNFQSHFRYPNNPVLGINASPSRSERKD